MATVVVMPAADVVGQEAAGTLDLVRTGLAGELLVGIEHLADAGRADGMAIGHQAATSIDGNRKRRRRAASAAKELPRAPLGSIVAPLCNNSAAMRRARPGR